MMQDVSAATTPLGFERTIPGPFPLCETFEVPKATPPKPYGRLGAKERPSDYAGRPILWLNAGWAIGDDGELQWFLLRGSGGRWMPRRFHVERVALLRSIRELCGPVDPAAIDAIGDWPAMYRPAGSSRSARPSGPD